MRLFLSRAFLVLGVFSLLAPLAAPTIPEITAEEIKVISDRAFYAEVQRIRNERLDRITVSSAKVSSYSSIDSCHYKNCAMASGKRAYVGAAACPRAVPLGKTVWINGKRYQCEDRTAKRYEGRYDIFTGYGKRAYKAAMDSGAPARTIMLVND